MAEELIIDAPARAQPRPASLWRNRDFNIFWTGQTFSALGDAFAIIAMPLLVLQATGSVAQMGLVTAIWGIGQIIMGVVAGLIVDRVNRRRLMIGCDIARTLLYALIPLGWALGGPQIWLIYVVMGAGSCFNNLFQVAYITAVANLVERDAITAANGRLGTTQAITFTAGPMLAGFVSALFGPATAIGADAATFAVSALSLTLIRLRRDTPADIAIPVSTSVLRRLWREWLDGFRFLFGNPVLRSTTILLSAFNLVTVAGLDLFIFHLKHDVGQDDNAVGIVLGLASVGTIIAALVIARLRVSLGFGACVIGGMIVGGIALAGVGLAPVVLLIAPAAMLFTFAENIKGISSMSLRQQITPDPILGRVTSVFWMLCNAPGPLGAAVVTALAAHYGAPALLVAMGGFGVILAAIGIATPARARFPEQTYAA